MQKQSFNRRSFLKTIGAAAIGAPFITRGLMAQSPNGMVRHASFGAAGMAWSDVTEFSKFPQFKLVAVAEVDLNRTAELKKKFPDVTVYQDWRKLLDKEAKNIDSVNVSTPDHMHASIDMSALQLGKHVYGQKPLAHDLYEVRKLTEFVSRGKLVTQMGIQIQSVNHYRLAVRLVQDGVIGKIKETHSWCPKSWGDPAPLPANTDPVPAGFDWDLWQGVCSTRPYIGNGYFHPATFEVARGRRATGKRFDFYWHRRGAGAAALVAAAALSGCEIQGFQTSRGGRSRSLGTVSSGVFGKLQDHGQLWLRRAAHRDGASGRGGFSVSANHAEMEYGKAEIR